MTQVLWQKSKRKVMNETRVHVHFSNLRILNKTII